MLHKSVIFRQLIKDGHLNFFVYNFLEQQYQVSNKALIGLRPQCVFIFGAFFFFHLHRIGCTCSMHLCLTSSPLSCQPINVSRINRGTEACICTAILYIKQVLRCMHRLHIQVRFISNCSRLKRWVCRLS